MNNSSCRPFSSRRFNRNQSKANSAAPPLPPIPPPLPTAPTFYTNYTKYTTTPSNYFPKPPPLPVSGLQPAASFPPAHYRCHKCGSGGHWIQFCPNINTQYNNNQHQQHPRATTLPPPPLPPMIAPRQGKEWSCSPCEKKFTTESQHLAHLKSHITCWFKDCSFSAAKRVVNGHYQLEHGQYSGSGLKEIDIEGQKFKVLVGNCPDEIRKWREQRRKRWPSASNIKQRAQNLKAREEAGDILNLKESKLSHEKAVCPPVTNALASPADRCLIQTKPLQKEKFDVSSSTPKKLISDIEEMEDGEILDSPQKNNAVSEAKPHLPKEPQPKLCKSMISKRTCKMGENCKFLHNIKDFPCKRLQRTGSCPHGDNCSFSHNVTINQDKINSVKVDKKRSRTTDTKDNPPVKKSRPSLLKKLMASDIKQDQSHILQVFRFMVSRKFFLEKL